MDEDSEALNWVLVDKVDCLEQSENSVTTVQDSDHESETSIITVSEPSDSSDSSEEQLDVLQKLSHETDQNTNITDNSADSSSETLDNVSEGTSMQNSTKENGYQPTDDDMSSISTSESSMKSWTFVNNKSELDVQTTSKPFFLDCSQEPILEISDIDTESIHDCQSVVKKEESTSKMSNAVAERIPTDHHSNFILNGMFISFLFLTCSVFFKFYLDNIESEYHSPLNTILDMPEVDKDIINFCIEKYKDHYSDEVIERCLSKTLKKKKKDMLKKSEIYLQIKERVLELRERELVEKEKEILNKLKKRLYNSNLETGDFKKVYNSKERNEDIDNRVVSFSNKKKKEKIKKKFETDDEYDRFNNIGKLKKNKKKLNAFNKKEKVKIGIDVRKEDYVKKHHAQFKNIDKTRNRDYKKGKILTDIKNKIKTQFTKPKNNFKKSTYQDKADSDDEWYIKYNPVKNTIEFINITMLPHQDSILIRNGNKTINGQWYFNLYGSSRTNFRSTERFSETNWYFKRNRFREHKRDKAKWYFDYMSARENNRWFF